MVDETSSDKPEYQVILAVALCALVIRVAFVVVMAESLDADPDAYRRIAENVRQHGVYGSGSSPTAFRPPLYPVLLAALAMGGEVSPSMTGGLNVLFGVATVVLTFLLAKQWRLGQWSFLAAALVAIDPILLNQSALVMTETLASLLAVAGMFALSHWSAKPSTAQAVIAGIVFGLACLCRPTFIPWLGLSLSVTGWLGSSLRAPSNATTGGSKTRPQPPLSRVIGQPLAFLLSAILVISPWILRNYNVFGVPKATTTHGGYTVLLGNNPSFYRYLREAPRGTTWDAVELADAWEQRRYSTTPNDAMWTLPHSASDIKDVDPVVRSEFEDDKFAYSLARRYITDEPGMFVYACFVRVSRLWQIIPYKTNVDESTGRMWLRVATGCWYSVLFVLAIVPIVVVRGANNRLFAERTTTIIWGLLLCFTFTAVHALYWSNMRMRAPLMPFICLMAASGIAWISTYVGDRKP
ncbi:MAG: glycosyltransferase family 39 protein [Planctomycetes bacterium]|nr:glycosyltransferase family 39 protein [Planctomycetota bacterium]